MLQSASRSPESKKKLAAMQWARAVFNWQPVTIKTLELLADDISETVNNLARREFSALNIFLARTDSVTEDTCNQDSGTERQEVLLEVLRMLHSPSDAFLDPKEALRAQRTSEVCRQRLASIATPCPGVI